MNKKFKADAFLYILSAAALLTGIGCISAFSRISPVSSEPQSVVSVEPESRPVFSFAQPSMAEQSRAVSETPSSQAAASSVASQQSAWKDTVTGRGNHPGNTANDGLFAEWRDGVVIFANPNDDFRLYRLNRDGKAKKISDDTVYYLNVIGDWIYFSDVQQEGKLFRIRPDGTEKTLVCQDDCWWTNARDGWLYFNGDSANLHRVSLDGKQYQKLTEEKVTWVNIGEDGWVYVILSRENERICKFKLDGSGKTYLTEEMTRFLVYDSGWLYYINQSDGNTIYKISTDGSGRTKLTAGAADFINVRDGWVYYSNIQQGGALYKMKTDGSQNTRLTSDNAYYINICGGYIYYINESDRGYLYRIKPDGTGRAKVGS